MARSFLSLFCPNAGGRLTRLIEWCDHYSPLAARDGDDGVILDITGCTHLFGGEGPFLLDIQRRLHRMKMQSRSAIADTRGAAWALARYGKRFIVHGKSTVSALDPLPVEALRLPEEITIDLRRLGLLTIAAVRKIERQSLSTRFGTTLLLRLDQAFHQAEDPFLPWRPPSPYRAARILPEPIATVPAVEYVLEDLLKEICLRLEKKHLGLRSLDFACHRVDGTVDRCEIRTSKPVRCIPRLMRLFRERLEDLEADFGFEAFVLSVPDLEAMDPVQLGFLYASEEPVEDEASYDALVDRLGMKLGFQEVSRIRVCESLLPEYSVEFRSVTASEAASAGWPNYRVRPIRLIEPPMRIHVSTRIPGEMPVQFFIGQQKHRITRSEGPERLIPEWWREDNSRQSSRDYYRIEDDQGFRFWIFQESEQWFLHGHLP